MPDPTPNIAPTPKQVVQMDASAWTAFRWQIALDVLSVFTPENATQARHAVAILKEADDKVTYLWQ